MARIIWDKLDERLYETGVDHGVLYRPDRTGAYLNGVPWNGLTGVTESPSGAEATAVYADNIKYLNLISAEEFGGTIEAFTYPDEFAECDGTASPVPGIAVGQQKRHPFGLCYRTILGNAEDANDYGYKLHFVYGAQAAPSEKAYETVNDSPEAITLSWEFTTTPIEAGEGLRPTAILTLTSTEVDPLKLKTLEDILYGTLSTAPRLPMPEEIYAIVGEGVEEVVPVKPTYDDGTHKLTIPTVTGLTYFVDGVSKVGGSTVTLLNGQRVVVFVRPVKGYVLAENYVDAWDYEY